MYICLNHVHNYTYLESASNGHGTISSQVIPTEVQPDQTVIVHWKKIYVLKGLLMVDWFTYSKIKLTQI